MAQQDKRLQAQAELWNHTFAYLKSMSLKCAVELGVPNAIHRHGGSASLPELLDALSLKPARLPHLRRLMRMLTTSGLFAVQCNGGELLYYLTPSSSLLVDGDVDGGCKNNLSPFVATILDPVIVDPSLRMGEWFRSKGAAGDPLELMNGRNLWGVMVQDAVYNEVFNNGMAADGRFVNDVVVGQCGDVFRGLRSLVDVGGGIGGTARAIAAAFPHVKCSVLDLPQVTAQARAVSDGSVEFITGDMFKQVPKADAVLLKWVLHDWGDEDCVKILKRCKEAIPSKEEGGKVIILEMVVVSGCQDIVSKEAQILFDILMMTVTGGVEREETEWKKIFTEAGFNGYKIIPVLGIRSLIEVYP